MRKLMLSLGLVLSSFLLHAQKNYTVKVTDSKTGNPVADASVKIKSTNKGGVTNAKRYRWLSRLRRAMCWK